MFLWEVEPPPLHGEADVGQAECAGSEVGADVVPQARPSIAARQASRRLRQAELAAVATEMVCVDGAPAEDSREDDVGRGVGDGDAKQVVHQPKAPLPRL
ncbi:hypothetical protein ACSSS7_006860 [Eimeria intestinalis]